PRISNCFNYSSAANLKICLEPDTYTLTTFGRDLHMNYLDQPTITLNQDFVSQFYSPATAQNMGSILDSIPGTTGSVLSEPDYFSCRNNAEPIGGMNGCYGSVNKAI